MTHSPEVSFVVIAHNEQTSIERALRSILCQDGNATSEVIVVDDGSTDGTGPVVAAVAAGHSQVRLVSLARNRGRGFARATGVAEVRGRFVAMVDADVVLPPDWLSRCLVMIGDADAVAGIAVPDGDVVYLRRRFGLTPKVLAHAADVTGSNAVYRRELFEHVSFDGELKEGEDVALSHALRLRAARVLTVPNLIVSHEETKSLWQSLEWMVRSGRGASRQLWRYRELRRPDVVFGGWIVVCCGALRLRRRPMAAAAPAAYLALAATAHVGRAFRLESASAGRFAGAVTLDTAMIAAYLAGRTIGTVSTPFTGRWRRAAPRNIDVRSAQPEGDHEGSA